MRTFALALATLGLAAAPAAAQAPKSIAVNVPEREGPVSYINELADILDNKCVGCHNEALAENKLMLDTVGAMLKGGKNGPAVVPGKADASLLFTMAAHRVEPFMPPVEKANLKPLTGDELGLLKLWIDAGAKDDSEEAAPEAKPVELGELPPGTHPINAVDMTDDGARVACGRGNVVQVFDADSGLEVIALGGHKDIVQSVRFSPNGRLLAAGSYEVVTLWNVPTGGPDGTLEGSGDQVKALAALPGGKGVVSTGLDKTLRFWNAEGKPDRQATLPANGLALAVSPDGKTVAVGCEDQTARLFNAEDGKELANFGGHGGPVSDLAFFPDGSRLVTASADGKARVWALPREGEEKAEPLVLGGSDKPLHAVAVTPDGLTVIGAGDDGKARFWKADGGEACRTIDAHDAPVLALAVGPKGDVLLTGSADKTARLIDVETGAVRLKLASHNGPVNAVAFADGEARLVTAGGDGGVKVWEAATGQGVIAFGHAAAKDQPAPPVFDVIAPEGGAIVTASADKSVRRWTYEGSWSERRPLGPHAFRVLALDFNPDGTLLAAGAGEPSRSGEIKVWEVGKGLPVRTLNNVHSDTVFGLRFSPDGSKLASAGADKFMKVTRTSDGKELRGFEGHSHHVMGVDWSADGKQLVTAGADDVLKVWDAETGEQASTIKGAGKQVTSVRWVPGKPEIVGASGDKTVRVWDAAKGGVLRNFTGPGDFVYAVASSKDGARLAAGGADGVLFVWDRKDGRVVRKIEPPAVPDAPKSQASR